jgi:hypothetical protein
MIKENLGKKSKIPSKKIKKNGVMKMERLSSSSE